MFVPRPLASLRQKTLPHNNSRLRDSGEVGSRHSRLTVYPACPTRCNPAKQRYFFCMLSVVCKLEWPEATSQPSPPNDSSPQHRPFRNGPRENGGVGGQTAGADLTLQRETGTPKRLRRWP